MLPVAGRTDVFIDGFNLYHGIQGEPKNKWLNIVALCKKYIPALQLGEIFYFTAYADHAVFDTGHTKRRKRMSILPSRSWNGRFSSNVIRWWWFLAIRTYCPLCWQPPVSV